MNQRSVWLLILQITLYSLLSCIGNPVWAFDMKSNPRVMPLASHLITFKTRDRWTYQVCTAFYYPIRTQYFTREGVTKQWYTVGIKVVKAASNSPSNHAFLVTLKGKTYDSKIDLANLMYFKQDDQGNVTLVEEHAADNNTILAPLMPGKWEDDTEFPAASLFSWILKGAGLYRYMRIHRRDLFDVIINGTKYIKIKGITLQCWRGNVDPPHGESGLELTSDNWYFAPEIGLPVKEVVRFNISGSQFTHGVFTVQLDSVSLK